MQLRSLRYAALGPGGNQALVTLLRTDQMYLRVNVSTRAKHIYNDRCISI
jgi:hypothetical protein